MRRGRRVLLLIVDISSEGGGTYNISIDGEFPVKLL
jgi:hypothetical protein